MIYQFPYQVEMQCIGSVCDEMIFSGAAMLIFNLETRMIVLDGLNAASIDGRFHFHGTIMTYAEDVPQSTARAAVNDVELDEDTNFLIDLDAADLDSGHLPEAIFELRSANSDLFIIGSGYPAAGYELE